MFTKVTVFVMRNLSAVLIVAGVFKKSEVVMLAGIYWLLYSYILNRDVSS